MATGLIHIYTGEGKGKTTAAVGLAVRALGHGMKVCYLYFNKQPELYGNNELQNLKQLGATVCGFNENGNWSVNSAEINQHIAISGLQLLSDFVKQKNPDLLILDEILISVQFGMIDEAELLEFIAQKPDKLELVLTGRGASDGLIEVADYVSYIQKVKHPFDRKIYSREGIEF